MGALPELPLEGWEPTKVTLHLWAQVVGKVRLASTAPQNHWWHAPLYVDARGLTTRRMHRGDVAFDLTFDLLSHELVVRTDDGRGDSFPLGDGLSVAEFDRRLHEMLAGLDLDVEIREHPFGVPVTTPFAEDREHAAYDREAIGRYFRTIAWVDEVLHEFSGWSTAKTSPVHLFWHSFDLALTRFSGRRAPAAAGLDPVSREAYSHEVISFGFWVGDDNVREPMLYTYAAPEPEGLTEHPLAPAEASWVTLPSGSMGLLPYAVVRAAEDPRTTALAFLQRGWEAGVRAGGWDEQALRSGFSPDPT